jgi:hypothetical protein
MDSTEEKIGLTLVRRPQKAWSKTDGKEGKRRGNIEKMQIERAELDGNTENKRFFDGPSGVLVSNKPSTLIKPKPLIFGISIELSSLDQGRRLVRNQDTGRPINDERA